MAAQPFVAIADAVRAPPSDALWRRLLSLAFSSRMLALADQAVVSGTSFLMTVLIGRFTHPSQLGLYVLGMSLFVAAMNFQHSLIALPYTIRRSRGDGDDSADAGNSLALSVGLTLTAAVVVAVVALAMSLFGADPRLAALTATLAAVLPFILLRDLGRDFGVARLRFGEVFALDAVVASFQLTALGLLAWFEEMSAAAALAVTGLACALTSAVGIFLTRKNFAIRTATLLQTARESWGMGKWLLGNLLALVMQVQVTYWLVAGFAGTTATGIFAACMSIAALANPMITGLSNPMFAKAAMAFAEGGVARLRREALRDTLLLGVATAVFCAVLALAGEDVVRLLFRGKQYAGHGAVVVLLALWQLTHAVGIPASNALSVMEHSRTNFYHGIAGTIISVAVVLAFVAGWGPVGAALGLLIGTAVRNILRWWALWNLSAAELKI